MKKSFILILLFFLFSTILWADLEVHYRCGNSSPTTAQLTPFMKVINTGPGAVAYQNLTIKYFYTKEGSADEEVSIDYTALGSANLVATVENGYLQVGFTAEAGNLAVNRDSGEIQIRIYKTDWSDYEQSNDASFAPQLSRYAPHSRIALYNGGQLVWGSEPGTTETIPPVTATPTPTPTPTPGFGNSYMTVPPFNRTAVPGQHIIEVSAFNLAGTTQVKYEGDLEGRGTLPLDITSDQNLSVDIEPAEVDIPNGYTGGQYLWIWDNYFPYGYNASVLSRPREIIITNSNASEDIRAKRLVFRDYAAPIVMPTLMPSPVPTPPPPASLNIILVNAVTGAELNAPDLVVNLIDYFSMVVIDTFTEAACYHFFNYYQSDGQPLLLEVSATGYRDLVTVPPLQPYNYAPEQDPDPDQVEVYPLGSATPVPVRSPLKTHRPRPVPSPEVDSPQWWQYLRAMPPVVTTSNYGVPRLSVELPSHHTAVRVVDWGEPVVSGTDVNLDLKLIEWDGPAAPWHTEFIHSYSLADLGLAGDFKLNLSSWGTPLKSYELTFPPVAPPVSLMPEGWEADPDPLFKLSTTNRDGRTILNVSTSLFMGRNRLREVLSWPAIIKNGDTFSLNTNVARGPGYGSYSYSVQYASCSYDLGNLEDGSYLLNISNSGAAVTGESFNVNASANPALPELPAPVFEYPALEIEVPAVAYPATDFEVKITNYGAPCTLETHPYLTGDGLTLSPAQLALDQGQSGVFSVNIDWRSVMQPEDTIYNAFIVTSARERRYISWQVSLDSSAGGGFYTISGTASAAEGITVRLAGPVSRTTRPDSSGYYEFRDLPGGQEYQVTVDYTPPDTVVTILTPAPGQALVGTVTVEANLQTAVCAYAIWPEIISIPSLDENLPDQDFILMPSDCYIEISLVEFYFNDVLIDISREEGMCYKNYTFNYDTTQLPDGNYTLGIAATDAGSQRYYTQIDVLVLNVLIGCLLGDANNDGQINIVDALMTAQYYVGLAPPDFRTECVDVNCDGTINIIDALMIAQYYVGLISSFNC